MFDAEPVVVPLEPQFRLSNALSSTSEETRSHMNKIPFVSDIGILLFVMIHTRPSIAYVISLVSRFMNGPSKNIGMLSNK